MMKESEQRRQQKVSRDHCGHEGRFTTTQLRLDSKRLLKLKPGT
jgi:hypothetical protein